jgi:hypothetical protein
MVYLHFIQLNHASGNRYVCPFENNRKSFVFAVLSSWVRRPFVCSEKDNSYLNCVNIRVVTALSLHVLAARVVGSTPVPIWL